MAATAVAAVLAAAVVAVDAASLLLQPGSKLISK